MIPRVDQNAPKCISIHGSQHKKMIQIPRPVFYGHIKPLLGQQWPIFSILSFGKRENYSKCVSFYMALNIKKGSDPLAILLWPFEAIFGSKMALFEHFYLLEEEKLF